MTSKEAINKSEKLKKLIIQKEKELKNLNNENKNLLKKLKDFESKTIKLSSSAESFRSIVWVVITIYAIYKIGFDFFTPLWFKGLIYLIILAFASAFVTVIIFESIPKLFGKNVAESEEYTTELDNLNEQINQCFSKSRVLEQDISQSKIQLSNLNSINSYVVKYDKDDNGLLDIAETTNIDKLLSKHQKIIREIEKDENTSFIPDLVKVNNYLNDYQNNLVEEFKIINSVYSADTKVDSNIKKFTEDFEIYKVLISSLVLMIDSIVNDNHILYYKLKESMDKYGVFDSNFQKNQIDLMRKNNQVTSQLIEETKSSKDAIIKSLESVEGALGGIQDELWDINIKLD